MDQNFEMSESCECLELTPRNCLSLNLTDIDAENTSFRISEEPLFCKMWQPFCKGKQIYCYRKVL